MSGLLTLLPLLLLLPAPAQPKLCWQECGGLTAGTVKDVEIAGCRRRAAYPLLQDFGCEGRTGPPCTVVRGDTVTLTVQWESPGRLANLTHQVYWESGLVDLPWPGQDTRGCPYLESGCSPASPPGPVTFSFPITVLGVYPPGYYYIKHKFRGYDRTGRQAELACFLFDLKIV